MSRVIKTAVRPVLVCKQCKERKVRCNRQQPCATCLKKGLDCTYISTPEDVNFNVFDGTTRTANPLRTPESTTSGESPVRPQRDFDYTGVNLYQSKDEYINFYDIQESTLLINEQRPSSHGPMAWSFLQRKDIALGFVFEYAQPCRKPGDPLLGFRKEVDARSVEPVVDKFEDTSGEHRDATYEARSSRQLIVDGEVPSRPLIDRIKEKLPKRHLLKTLIHAFVTNVGAFMSYCDPDVFLGNIESLVGPLDAPYEDYPEFKAITKENLAYVGMMLISMRLGFLSLISHGIRLGHGQRAETSVPVSSPCYELIHNPVDLAVIELAEECFKKFNLLVKPDMPLLQFAMMMRIYQKFAPEFGEGIDGGDSQLFTGVLVQMAISFGLNRDPDSSHLHRHMPLKEKNLRRQVWYSLLFSDAIEAYSFGNPLNCDVQFFDTKTPKNIGNDGYAANTVYEHIDSLVSHIRDAVRLVIDVSGRTKVADLCLKMNSLETFIQDTFGSIGAHLQFTPDPQEQKRRISSVKLSLSIRIFYLGVMTHLFLHYCETNNTELAYFYCRKLLSIELLQFLPNIFVIITRAQEVLGKSADLILIPNLLQVTHRVFLSVMSLYVRLKFVHFTWTRVLVEVTQETKETCEAILRGLDTVFNIIQTAMKKVAPRYYYAYKILRTMTVCLPVIRDEQFYQSYYPGAINLRTLPFDPEKLPELLEIINLGLSRLYETHKTQADLVMLMKNGPPVQPCGARLNEEPAVADTPPEVSTQTPAGPQYDMFSAGDDMDNFFAKLLADIGDTSGDWAKPAQDGLNFDFFYSAGNGI